MSDAKFMFCESCAFKKVILKQDDLNGLEEIKTSEVLYELPKIDQDAIFKKRLMQIKCPQCGRGVFLKELPLAYKKTIQKLEAEAKKKQQEEDVEQRILDGIPPKRSNTLTDD